MAPDHGNDVNRNVREVLLSEYAKEIGLTPQALHKRIKNGVLKGFQREEGGRKRWYVLIEDKSATESEPKEPKDDMYRELTAQSNQALIREQELNNKLIDQNRDLQEQLKEQRLLLHQGQEGAT